MTSVNSPLVAERIVVLATLVKSKEAVDVQFAANQKNQKTHARRAVSSVERGGGLVCACVCGCGKES